MWFKATTRCIGPILVVALGACQGEVDPRDDQTDGDDLRQDEDNDSDSEDTLRDDDKNSGKDSSGQDGDSDGDKEGDKQGDGSEKDGTKDHNLPFNPPEPQLRALLATQYRASIRDIFGDKAAEKAAPPLDPSPIDGFAAIGASQLSIDSGSVEQYESSAVAVAKIVSNDRDRVDALAGCSPGNSAQSCLDKFVSQVGQRVFRRPLTKTEHARYAGLMSDSNYYKRVEIIVSAMLQSPFFLYQIEQGNADGASNGKRKLNGYELATRMSYFLLGTTPSPDLLKAAENGELDTEKGVRDVAAEMLQDPKARTALEHFWYEMLHLDHIDGASKDKGTFKLWDENMARSVKQETLTFLEHVIWDDGGSFRDIWTADYTYANRDIARLYNLSTKGMGKEFTKIKLPEDSKRAGLLGQASFLASVSHATTTSPTLRGKMVMEKFLCTVIPAPPPEAASEFKPGDGSAKTKAELLKQHLEDKTCNSCHQYMDPIGLGLENFNAIGQFRFEENGVTLHTEHDAQSLGIFDGPRELGALLADDERAVDCFTRNLFRFATGHTETKGEEGSILDMVEAFNDSEQDIPSLLVDIVSSPAFRFVGENNE